MKKNSLNWLTLLFCSISLISNAYAGSTLSAGTDHVCAVQEDDTLICWGANDHNQADPPSGTFSEIEVGFYFGCGLKTDGTLTCWGQDTTGETSPPPGQFIQIAVGGNHACALTDAGEPICWGDNTSGQVSYLPGPFQQLALGNNHSCGLTFDGSVECWGSNEHEQSNEKSETFSRIAAGFDTTCGIKTDGAAICWGRTSNSYGFLTQIDFALNGDPDGDANQAVKDFFLCGLKADNSLSCPAMSSVPSGVFSYVTTGGHTIHPCHKRCSGAWAYGPSYHYEISGFACGIRENGLVTCWGSNNNDRATPPVGVKLKQPSDFTPPSHPDGYTQADLENARQEAQKACQANPASCGIDISGEVAAAVIGQDLSLHVSKAQYKTLSGTQQLWVELSFIGQNYDGKLLWELTDYGVVE